MNSGQKATKQTLVQDWFTNFFDVFTRLQSPFNAPSGRILVAFLGKRQSYSGRFFIFLGSSKVLTSLPKKKRKNRVNYIDREKLWIHLPISSCLFLVSCYQYKKLIKKQSVSHTLVPRVWGEGLSGGYFESEPLVLHIDNLLEAYVCKI